MVGLFSVLLVWANFLAMYDLNVCIGLVERNFFNQKYVQEALSLHPEINQGQWVPIVNSIKTRQAGIYRLLIQEASLMAPNPLRYPYQDDAAKELLFRVLKQTLVEALRENLVDNPVITEQIFLYLKNRPDMQFSECVAPVKKPNTKVEQTP